MLVSTGLEFETVRGGLWYRKPDATGRMNLPRGYLTKLKSILTRHSGSIKYELDNQNRSLNRQFQDDPQPRPQAPNRQDDSCKQNELIETFKFKAISIDTPVPAYLRRRQFVDLPHRGGYIGKTMKFVCVRNHVEEIPVAEPEGRAPRNWRVNADCSFRQDESTNYPICINRRLT
ncbi:hypothetical protein BLNAU_24568 [Blattamonas nauphoetae]|uniref:Uncharacterized protein n=1 Tax=Blattamonas nauphoetae TaxID=2049346 RepID=A0ABQ9WM05_9EUKA|nr:hypothetical protein BLNAU_24568 [Blattamonas nauphoetae]